MVFTVNEQVVVDRDWIIEAYSEEKARQLYRIEGDLVYEESGTVINIEVFRTDPEDS